MKTLFQFVVNAEIKSASFSKPLLLTIFLLSISILSGQDKIVLKDSTKIFGTLIAIDDNYIKYKDVAEPYGLVLRKTRSAVAYIIYKNKMVENFDQEPAPREKKYFDPLPEAPNYKSEFDPDNSDFPDKRQKIFSGPKIAVITVGEGTEADYLNSHGERTVMTQFGWQFERRLFTIDKGPTGFVQFIPSLAGIDQGLFLPSAAFLIGLRSGKDGAPEFALGPNFSLTADHNGTVNGAAGVLISVGVSYAKSNVVFPINISLIPSVGSAAAIQDPHSGQSTTMKFESGIRVSLSIGFIMRRK